MVSWLKSRCRVLSTSRTPQAAPSISTGTLTSEMMPCSCSMPEDEVVLRLKFLMTTGWAL